MTFLKKFTHTKGAHEVHTVVLIVRISGHVAFKIGGVLVRAGEVAPTHVNREENFEAEVVCGVEQAIHSLVGPPSI